MSFAAVDIGNTAIKYAFWRDSGNPKSGWSSMCKSLPEVMDKLREYGVRKVAFSTTRDLYPEEVELIDGAGWWEFTSMASLPLKVRYGSLETLGVDRLAAAVGAWKRYPGEALMIADVGTALTIDAVSDQGEFLGGNISAGITMRLDALHIYTSRLPKVDYSGDEGLIGHDTISAIQCGARWGVAAEIAGMYRLLHKEYGCRRIVLTGGSAPYIQATVREALEAMSGVPGTSRHNATVPMEYIAELVEEGIKIAYEYNNEEN